MRERFECGSFIAFAGDQALGGGKLRGDRAHGADQGGEVFFFLQAGGAEDRGGVVAQAQGLAEGGAVVSGGEFRGIDAVVDGGDAVRWAIAAGESGGADGARDGDCVGGVFGGVFVEQIGEEGLWAGAGGAGGGEEMLGGDADRAAAAAAGGFGGECREQVRSAVVGVDDVEFVVGEFFGEQEDGGFIKEHGPRLGMWEAKAGFWLPRAAGSRVHAGFGAGDGGMGPDLAQGKCEIEDVAFGAGENVGVGEK